MRPFILTSKPNTRSKSKPEIQGEMRVENINEPLEQEIYRPSDSDSNSYQSTNNGSDGEDG